MAKLNIAIFNGDRDVLNTLQDALEFEGYNVRCGLITEVISGKLKVAEFVKSFRPDLVLWDVIPAYEQSISILDRYRHHFGLRDECVIVTSTNRRALEHQTGQMLSLEIVEKPFDFGTIVRIIEKRIEICKKAKKKAGKRPTQSV